MPWVKGQAKEWYFDKFPSKHSLSWTVAHNLYIYLATSGRSSRVATYSKSKGLAAPPKNSKAIVGDVVFYDWEGDGDYDHVSIVTGYSGGADLISQHTTNRRNVIWHLKPHKLSSWHKIVFGF